ncbi:MAG: ABC transporter ATP-binding protein [Burkholderiaceae bacterium]
MNAQRPATVPAAHAGQGAGPPLLELDRLSVRVGARRLIDAISLRAERGQCWALLGANGRGKSSLLLAIAGLLPLATGEVRLAGRPLSAIPARELARLRALVEQHRQDGFAQSVRDHVALSRRPYVSGWHLDAADAPEVQQALRLLDLESLAGRDIRTLSGGERQRVAIAAAVAQDTPVLLLDEPIAHLDPPGRIAVMRRLLGLSDRLLILAMHEPEIALEFCSHALLLGVHGWHAGPISDLHDPARLAELYGGRPRLLRVPGDADREAAYLVRWD